MNPELTADMINPFKVNGLFFIVCSFHRGYRTGFYGRLREEAESRSNSSSSEMCKQFCRQSPNVLHGASDNKDKRLLSGFLPLMIF